MRTAIFAPVRLVGPAILFAVALVVWPLRLHAAQADDHQAAVAALTDLHAAISQLVRAEASFSTNRNDYHGASQRAINALEGSKGPDYVGAAGNPGDTEGSIGHIDHLLDRTATPVWADDLRSAEANMRAAVAQLLDARRARELMDWEIANSRALVNLLVAEGRSSETGTFGGLQGALANTVLGVPGDAQQADACVAPPATPAYGTHGGYIAWVSVPASQGEHRLAENPGGSDVSVEGNLIVLHTAAAAKVARQCDGPPAKPVQHAAASAAAGLPALFTKTQAEAGQEIFSTTCVSCHGTNMQGTAAPAVAGNEFLKAAKQNGWSLTQLRYLVVTMMPMNAARSLSPDQYAEVLAFLLASNCYPPGATPFPTHDEPGFADIKLGPVASQSPDQNKFGVCRVP
jgi:polar amino acid transport system substrate-binding protein